MGNILATLDSEEIQPLKEKTGFSESQIRRLYARFCHLDKANKGFLTQDDLKLIPQLAVNPLGNRIIQSFFIDDADPTVLREKINFQHFACVMSRFRRIKEGDEPDADRNSVDQKVEFVFRVYDVDRDGFISKDDLLMVLRSMVGLHVSEDQLKSIAKRTMREADKDKDDKISLQEFKAALGDIDVNSKMTIGFS